MDVHIGGSGRVRPHHLDTPNNGRADILGTSVGGGAAAGAVPGELIADRV